MRSHKITQLLNKPITRGDQGHQRSLPPLICILDDLESYKQYIPYLPKHQTLVIVRDYHNPQRQYLAHTIARHCKAMNIKILIAGDPQLAIAVNADGLHLSERNFFQLRFWKYKMPKWIITTTAHALGRLYIAQNHQLDAILYSSVFFTKSHPERKPLGILRFMRDTNMIRIPIYALGGINAGNINKLNYSNIAGIAGISLFTN